MRVLDLVFVVVSFLLMLVAVMCLLVGCATLDSYAQQHPDVVAKAKVAIELAQCADDAVTKYREAEIARLVPDAGPPPEPVHIDPNPYTDASVTVIREAIVVPLDAGAGE